MKTGASLSLPSSSRIGCDEHTQCGATSSLILSRVKMRAGMRPLVIAIASLAGSLVLENIVRWFFANDHRSFDLPIVRDMRFGDLRMGPQQLAGRFEQLAHPQQAALVAA